MLGRRSAQAGLFDSGNLLGAEQVRQIPFYGQMAATWREIFRDEHFAGLYADKGRHSVPPSVLATATVLQRFENISDQEVVERTRYDLRWKAVFDTNPCSLRPLFAKSSLQLFRLRLVLNEKQGLIFDAVLAEARRRGLLPKKMQLALDSSPVRGRGAVKDAFNLLSDAIGRVVRAVAKEEEKDPLELARSRGLERHLQRGSVKGTRVVDWEDSASVQAFLAELVGDCKKAVEAAKEAGTATAETELLAKVVAENVEETPAGPQIPQKVPKGRTTSVHDEEMRHGHKSTGKLYTGHKAHVGVDTSSKFVTAIEMSEPSSAEGKHVGSLIGQSEARTGSSVTEGLGDCAYSTTTAQAQATEAKVPVVTKMPSPPKGRFGPGDFAVSEDGKAAQCPAALPSAKVGRSKEDIVHRWSSEQCGPCPLKDRCLHGEAKQRSLRVAPGFHERRQREAYAHSSEGREKLRLRTLVEHAIGYLKNLGAGQARYTGRAKTLFQWLVCGAVVNLRHLWKSVVPAAVCVLLLTSLPLLLLALSAAPAHALTTNLETTRQATDTPDQEPADLHGLRGGPMALAAVGSGALPQATPSVVRCSRRTTPAAAPLAQSRRWLLSCRSSTRGPPEPTQLAAGPEHSGRATAPASMDPSTIGCGICGELEHGSSGVGSPSESPPPCPRPRPDPVSTERPRRARSRPTPPELGGSPHGVPTCQRPARSLVATTPWTPVNRGAAAAPTTRSAHPLHSEGGNRARITESRDVRRMERSCAGRPRSGTGAPRAPPVSREGSSRGSLGLLSQAVAAGIPHSRPGS